MDENDETLWQKVVSDVKPLKGRKKPTLPLVVPSSKLASKPTPPPAKKAHSGTDGHTRDRLKRGKLRPEARLDLHGFTQKEAHQRLRDFFARAQGQSKKCVLVITGRGDANPTSARGVLRRQFPSWMETKDFQPYVAAYEAAQPKDGGAGAFYVFLKKY